MVDSSILDDLRAAYSQMLGDNDRPVRVEIARDVKAALLARSGRLVDWDTPVDRLLGMPVEVEPSLRPGEWRMYDRHNRTISSLAPGPTVRERIDEFIRDHRAPRFDPPPRRQCFTPPPALSPRISLTAIA